MRTICSFRILLLRRNLLQVSVLSGVYPATWSPMNLPEKPYPSQLRYYLETGKGTEFKLLFINHYIIAIATRCRRPLIFQTTNSVRSKVYTVRT